MISRLPKDVLFHLTVENLRYPDIVRLCRTSKYFNRVLCGANSPHFWRVLYERDISAVHPPEPRGAYRGPYLSAMKTFQPMSLKAGLVFAAKSGYEKLVDRVLFLNDAAGPTVPKLTKVDYNGAMAGAAKGGYVDIVSSMMKRGADNYNTAMTSAAAGGHGVLVNLMLEKGATDYNGAMREAAFFGHRDMVNLMLEKGATNYYDGLYGAAVGGHRDIARSMIERGVTEDDLEEALLGAARSGNRDIASLLLAEGATNYDRAIKVAKGGKHYAFARLIERAKLGQPLQPHFIELRANSAQYRDLIPVLSSHPDVLELHEGLEQVFKEKFSLAERDYLVIVDEDDVPKWFIYFYREKWPKTRPAYSLYSNGEDNYIIDDYLFPEAMLEREGSEAEIRAKYELPLRSGRIIG